MSHKQNKTEYWNFDWVGGSLLMEMEKIKLKTKNMLYFKC